MSAQTDQSPNDSSNEGIENPIAPSPPAALGEDISASKSSRSLVAHLEKLFAAGALEQVLAESANSDLWGVNTVRLRALRQLGRHAETAALARSMLTQKPNHRDTVLQLVRALRDDGNLVLALRETAKATLLFPEDDEVERMRHTLMKHWVERPAPGQVAEVAAPAAPGLAIANMRRMMEARHDLSVRDQEALEHIAKRYQDGGDHDAVADLLLPLSDRLGVGLLLRCAASLRALGRPEEQLQVLTAALRMEPSNHKAMEGLRDLAFAERDYALAFHYNSSLLATADTGGNRLVQARIYVALGCDGFQSGHYLQPVTRDQAFAMALTILTGIVGKNPKEHRAWELLGRMYAHFGNFEKAQDAYSEAFRIRPTAQSGMELARLQLDAGRIPEALKTCDAALQVARNNSGLLYLRRFISGEAFRSAPAPAEALRMITVIQPRPAALSRQIVEMQEVMGLSVTVEALLEAELPGGPSAIEQVAALAEAGPDRWFVLPLGDGPTLHDLVCFATGMSPRRMAVWTEFTPGVKQREVLIRGKMLAVIAHSLADAPPEDSLAEAVQARALRLRSNLPTEPQKTTKTAWIVSRYGHAGFGGAEQFMRNIARAYLDEGYQVDVIGILPHMAGQSGVDGDLRWSFVEDAATGLRQRAVKEGVDVVHIVGMSYEVVGALEGLDTRVVYGFHFFRDLFIGDCEEANFPYFDGTSPVRAESHAMLTDLSVLYANSHYSQAVVEQSHGLRVPVVYSTSYNPPPPMVGPADSILLMNARMDKGFGLVLEMAARLPHRKFITVASQSSRPLAERWVMLRGLKNVTVLDRTEDIDGLYGLARVVVVPSFEFVETFSRVVIEAQARGRVVLGARAGNIPNLITDPDFVLPEDPALWAERAEAMFTDDDAHAAAVKAALANAAQFGPDLFRTQSRRLVKSLGQRILVGVGGGVGNTLHATPLIRRISEHFGVPVDVVISEGGRSYFDVVDDPDLVGTIHEIGPLVLAKPYDLVFITNCFGEVIPTFNTARQVNSRDTDRFIPGVSAHETEFNLQMGAQLLGIPRNDGDTEGYFFGNRGYVPPTSGIIGFHGGSKDGHWVAKRWPYYEELAAALIARGYRVVSFGIAEELVPGTEDWTGGTLGEMAERMRGIDHLVTNDSGVMNIANALGIPLTAIFAPTDVGTRAPTRPTSRVVAIQKDCAPCEVKNPAAFRDGKCACIAEIPMERVLEAVLEAEVALMQQGAMPSDAAE